MHGIGEWAHTLCDVHGVFVLECCNEQSGQRLRFSVWHSVPTLIRLAYIYFCEWAHICFSCTFSLSLICLINDKRLQNLRLQQFFLSNYFQRLKMVCLYTCSNRQILLLLLLFDFLGKKWSSIFSRAIYYARLGDEANELLHDDRIEFEIHRSQCIKLSFLTLSVSEYLKRQIPSELWNYILYELCACVFLRNFLCLLLDFRINVKALRLWVKTL